jgi:glycosyltransferase involved in cell wall biosynthesis
MPKQHQQKQYLLTIIIPIARIEDVATELLEFIEKAQQCWSSRVEFIFVHDGPVGGEKSSAISALPTHFLVLDKKSGANAARREGLRNSSGMFVHFHDSDDAFESRWLDVMIPVLEEKAPTVDFILTPRVECTNGVERYVKPSFMKNHREFVKVIPDILVFRNPVGPIGGVTFRYDMLEEWMFPDMASSQDWFLYQCVFKSKDVRILYENSTYFKYNRGRAGSISSSAWRKVSGAIYIAKFSPIGRVPARVRFLYIIDNMEGVGRLPRNRVLEVYLRKSLVQRRIVRGLVNAWIKWKCWRKR